MKPPYHFRLPESFHPSEFLRTPELMRLDGSIPFEAIEDETRPVVIWNTHRHVRTFIDRELDNFLSGYWRDLLQSQPNHPELLAEKISKRWNGQPILGCADSGTQKREAVFRIGPPLISAGRQIVTLLANEEQ